jgi:hypothetical protein
MKTSKYVVLGLMILGMVFQYPAFAAEVSDVIRDHKALAASYQEKAAAQDALIAEHQQMKKDYDKRFTPGNASKIGIPSKVKEMDKHCGKIIKAAQQEKQALLDFSKWHEMRAAELEGR